MSFYLGSFSENLNCTCRWLADRDRALGLRGWKLPECSEGMVFPTVHVGYHYDLNCMLVIGSSMVGDRGTSWMGILATLVQASWPRPQAFPARGY